MPTAPKVKLNNGNEMPALGMGVVFLDIGDTQRTIDDAIAAGYRLFDNAAFYGNEEKIGQALSKEALLRVLKEHQSISFLFRDAFGKAAEE